MKPAVNEVVTAFSGVMTYLPVIQVMSHASFSGMMTYLPVIQIMSHASCSEGCTQLAWQVRLELLVGCIHLDDRGWLGWLGVTQGLQR